MNASVSLIRPDWPAPASVRAGSTTRAGGVSPAPWHELNLSLGGGDDPARVRVNRERLVAAAGLPAEPLWLEQVHGTAVVHAPSAPPGRPRADAAWSDRPGVVCGVLTADCVPLLLSARAGGLVAAVHAGWRGLAAGVIEATVAALPIRGPDLLAWLGPAIGPGAYEVGTEVHRAFTGTDADAAACFAPTRPGHWHADLYALSRLRLARLGITEIYGGDRCTYREPETFFSHRRDGPTGRMLTFIWWERSG